MQWPTLGRWALGIWLILKIGPVFSANWLFLADREVAPLEAALRNAYRTPALPVAFSLPDSGTTLRGFLATEHLASRRALDSLDALADFCGRQQIDVVVAWGGEAIQAARRRCASPALLAGMTREQFAPLLAAHRAAPVSAIYLEADPLLDLRLARVLLPKAHHVGVLVPASVPAWLASLRAEARRLDLALVEIVAADDLDAVRALRPRLASLDVVLLPPESNLVSAWSLKPLLLMTIRQGIPVLGGASTRYVEAGVLAAVVADEERLPAQMQSLIADLARGRTPSPAYPAAVQVVVNPAVAQTLGISAEAIQRAHSLFSSP
ncbi:MAG: hypothetical protein EKK71_15100 [Candidatus Competibacteraceae bacterium]|nr:MAG: hypothetical protein EKK71_15100 [Candidatus Competibacteraceae bacterium]